jgi:hypothetical protein
MKLQINGSTYPDVRGWVGIDFWTSDPSPERFVVRVSKAYARNRGWDLSLGLERCIAEHREDLRCAAQRAFDEGATELLLLT